EIIAILTAVKTGNTGVPGSLRKRDELRDAAVAIDQQMRGHTQVFQFSEGRMRLAIQAIGKQPLDEIAAELSRRQTDVVNHQQIDDGVDGTLVEVRAGTMRGRPQPAIVINRKHASLLVADRSRDNTAPGKFSTQKQRPRIARPFTSVEKPSAKVNHTGGRPFISRRLPITDSSARSNRRPSSRMASMPERYACARPSRLFSATLTPARLTKINLPVERITAARRQRTEWPSCCSSTQPPTCNRSTCSIATRSARALASSSGAAAACTPLSATTPA